MSDEEITSARAGALLAAAVQGVAWALIEYETDTADRGVSEEHYRDAVQRAQNILPTLLPGVVAEEPDWQYSYVERVGRFGDVHERVTFESLRSAQQYLRDNADLITGWNREVKKRDHKTAGVEKRQMNISQWVPVKQEGAEK